MVICFIHSSFYVFGKCVYICMCGIRECRLQFSKIYWKGLDGKKLRFLDEIINFDTLGYIKKYRMYKKIVLSDKTY